MIKKWMPLILVVIGCIFVLLAIFAKLIWIVVALGGISLIFIIFWKLEVGLAILTFSAVLDGLLRASGRLIGSLWDDALFILIILALIWRLAKEHRDDFHPTILWWAVAIFLVLAIISGLLSTLPYGHIITAIRAMLQGSILFFVIVNAKLDKKTILHLASLLIICAVAVAGYGLIQRVSGAFTPQGWLDKKEVVNITRATSFLGSPNATAGFLALVLPVSLGMLFKVKRFWAKFFWSFATIIIFLGLYATLNRAAWIGIGIGLVVFAIAAGKRSWIAVFVAGLATAIMILPDLRFRFSSLFSEEFATLTTLYGRTFRWETALQIFADKPIFGLGPGSFGGAVAYGIQAFGGLYVDNFYLLVLSNYGLVGIISFFFILVATIRESFRGLMATIGNDRILIAGIIGGLFAFIVHLFFENLWDITPLIITFWLMAGLAAGFVHVKKGVKNEDL